MIWNGWMGTPPFFTVGDLGTKFDLTRHENFVRTGFKLYVFDLIDQSIDIAAELALLTECTLS